MEALSNLLTAPIDAVTGIFSSVAGAPASAATAATQGNATFTEDVLRMLLYNLFHGDSRLQQQTLQQYYAPSVTVRLNEGLLEVQGQDQLQQLLRGLQLLAAFRPEVLEISSTADRAIVLLNLNLAYKLLPLTWWSRIPVATTITLTFGRPEGSLTATNDVITGHYQELSLPDLFWWNPVGNWFYNRAWAPYSGRITSKFLQIEEPFVHKVDAYAHKYSSYLKGGAGYVQALLWTAEDLANAAGLQGLKPISSRLKGKEAAAERGEAVMAGKDNPEETLGNTQAQFGEPAAAVKRSSVSHSNHGSTAQAAETSTVKGTGAQQSSAIETATPVQVVGSSSDRSKEAAAEPSSALSSPAEYRKVSAAGGDERRSLLAAATPPGDAAERGLSESEARYLAAGERIIDTDLTAATAVQPSSATSASYKSHSDAAGELTSSTPAAESGADHTYAPTLSESDAKYLAAAQPSSTTAAKNKVTAAEFGSRRGGSSSQQAASTFAAPFAASGASEVAVKPGRAVDALSEQRQQDSLTGEQNVGDEYAGGSAVKAAKGVDSVSADTTALGQLGGFNEQAPSKTAVAVALVEDVGSYATENAGY